MSRVLVALLLLGHGAIHWLGAAKGLGWAAVDQLSQPVSRFGGIGWLVAGICFLTSTALLVGQRGEWWAPALLGVALSQVLVVGAWSDAKFGTIANGLILLLAMVALGRWQFEREASAARRLLLSAPAQAADREAGLPTIVATWLDRSGASGPTPRSVHLTQRGRLRMKPDGAWLPFTAEQDVTIDPPGFVWRANIRAAPLVHIAGLDQYRTGRGSMRIKLQSLFPLANASGPAIDQGAQIRYLAETVWLPWAARSGLVDWESQGATTARGTLRAGEQRGSGTFEFSETGDVLSFEAKRPYQPASGQASTETWVVTNLAWGDRSGVRVPTKSSVTWRLPSRDFTWLELEVTGIEYRR